MRCSHLTVSSVGEIFKSCSMTNLRSVKLWGAIAMLTLKPGKWIIHCHIAHHTTNNNVEMKGGGGLMMLMEVNT